MATTTLRAGRFRGVRSTTDPEDAAPELLDNLVNGYIPDPAAGSAAYSRPGFSQPTSIPSATPPCTDIFGFVSDGNTPYNFLIENGKVFRITTALSSAPTDVTPTNVAIHTGTDSFGDPAGPRFAYCVQLNGELLVSDGYNKPWRGTNLSSTPITATVIEWNTPAVKLSIGSTVTRVANSSTVYSYYQNGATTVATLAANAVGTAFVAGTVPIDTWAIYRFSIDNLGAVTITPGTANYTTGYATEAAAIAALPAVPTGPPIHFNLGYVTVKTAVGFTWVAGTNALEGGGGANPSSDTNYYAGEGTPWAAYHAVIAGGCYMVILSQLGGTSERTNIGWSEPNQPGTGYQQTDYDNAWELTQTGSDPLYALAPYNGGVCYARSNSWGRLRGQPSVNFKNDATHDAISVNIGTVSPKAVRQFGQWVYFIDAIGRPYRFNVGGGEPEPLWLWLRKEYDTQAAAGNTLTTPIEQYAWGIVEPNLNLYLVGCWPLAATSPFSPTTLYAFDANTGIYMGTWTVGGDRYAGVGGLLTDANGQKTLLIVGRQPAGTSNGYLWKLAKISDNVWQDNSATITVSATSQRLGYSDNNNVLPHVVRVVTNNVTPVVGTITTSNAADTAIGTVTPVTSTDGTYRATFGPKAIQGRGLQIKVSPSTTTSQWQLYSISADVTVQKAPATEQ